MYVTRFRSGVSLFLGPTPTGSEIAEFEAFVRDECRLRKARVLEMREEAYKNAHKFYQEEYPERYAPFYLKDGDKDPVYYVCPKIKAEHVVQLGGAIGIKNERWKEYFEGDGKGGQRVKPKKELACAGDSWLHKIAQQELKLLIHLSMASPALGLALGIRRIQAWDPKNRRFLEMRPSVFSKQGVMDTIRPLIPQRPIEDVSNFKTWAEAQVPPPASPAPAGGGATSDAGSASVADAPPTRGARPAEGRQAQAVSVKVVRDQKTPAVNALDLYKAIAHLAGQRDKRQAQFIAAHRSQIYLVVERLLDRGHDAGRVITALLGYVEKQVAKEGARQVQIGVGPVAPLAPLGAAVLRPATLPLFVQ